MFEAVEVCDAARDKLALALSFVGVAAAATDAAVAEAGAGDATGSGVVAGGCLEGGFRASTPAETGPPVARRAALVCRSDLAANGAAAAPER